MINISAQELAERCVNSAALLQGEDPQRFWGDKYGDMIAKSITFINEIGLEQAIVLFSEGKLNFAPFD